MRRSDLQEAIGSWTRSSNKMRSGDPECIQMSVFQDVVAVGGKISEVEEKLLEASEE